MPPTLAGLAADIEHHAKDIDELKDTTGQHAKRLAILETQIAGIAGALAKIDSAVEQARGEIALVRREMPRGWTLTIPPGSGRAVGLIIGGIVAGLLTGGVGGAGRDIALEVVREVVGIEAPRQPVAVPVPVPMPVPMAPASP